MDHAPATYVPVELRPPRPSGSLTLADLRPGDVVRVNRVPVPVRDALAGLGVLEGAWIRCESVDRYVVVRTVDGSVPLERGLVAAVEVEVLDPPADLRTGTWPVPDRLPDRDAP